MEITEVDVKLHQSHDRLRAFCAVVFDDCFVVKDVKVLERSDGSLLLSMPDRELADRCPFCKSQTPYKYVRCGKCGAQLAPDREPVDPDTGRTIRYACVAYPLNMDYRREMERRIFSAYRLAVEFEDDSIRSCAGCGRPLDLFDVVNLRDICLADVGGTRELYCAGACWAAVRADVEVA